MDLKWINVDLVWIDVDLIQVHRFLHVFSLILYNPHWIFEHHRVKQF